MIKLNGSDFELNTEIDLYSLLQDKNYDVDKVAVILNDDIVSKNDYKEKLIRDGDSIEVVSFVGGG